MADKKLNEVTTVNSGTLANVKNFLAVMNDGSIQQMSKSDLASVVGVLLSIESFFKDSGVFNGDDFDNAGMGIHYIYQDTDYANRPDKLSPGYGLLLSFVQKTRYAIQFYIAPDYPNVLYIRVRKTPEQGWKQWYKIGLTSI